MGENAPYIADHDRRLRALGWKVLSANWMSNGPAAHRMMQWIKENELSDTTLCTAGTFDGGIYLPFALSAEMFRNCNAPYDKILNRVARRWCIRVD